MPQIQISDSTHDRLLRLITTFADTPDTVIGRLLDEREASSNTAVPSTTGPTIQALQQDPDAPDNLTFTRVRSASFGNIEISRPKWNTLVRTAHQEARQRLGSFHSLASITITNIQEGKHEDYGYTYLPEADISVQGLAANLAWPSSLKLARHLKVPIRVVFEWHNKDGAAHPGKRGILEWTPAEE